MKDKYYQPSKEEFYIGFEFESNYILFRDHPGNSWTKSILSDEHNWFYDSYDNDAIPSEFRVKYLDRSDIEDLGFEQLDKVNTRRYIKGNVSIWLGDYTQGMLTKIEVRDKLRAVGYTKLFIGDVKNKSELKILLKQLNIQ